MRRQTLLVVLAAAMLALAGCGGALTDNGADSESDATDGADDGAVTDADGEQTGDTTGTVRFYISDQPTAIDEFRHLNVTITQIGFERADANGEEDKADDESATETPNATATPVNESADTDTDDGTPVEERDDEERDDGNGDEEHTGWVTRDVDSRTVDLTRLQGDNATLVGTPELPAGEYTKVFVEVERVDATLQNGESANVKLPSGRLQLTTGFVLKPNGTVEFVYDISVVRAGDSGKYILKPVISDSGPDKNIERVDEDDDGDDDDGEDDDGEDDTDEGGDGGPPEDDPGQGN